MKILKYLLLYFICIGCVKFASAQAISKPIKLTQHDLNEKTREIGANTLITDQNADKFIGTWVWKRDNNVLRIKLKKVLINWGSKDKPAMFEGLTGGYQFVKNGKEVSFFTNEYPISGSTEGQPSIAYLSIYNSKTPKNVAYLHTSNEYILTYINSSTVRLELSKRIREGSPNKNNLTLPIDIVLTKE